MAMASFGGIKEIKIYFIIVTFILLSAHFFFSYSVVIKSSSTTSTKSTSRVAHNPKTGGLLYNQETADFLHIPETADFQKIGSGSEKSYVYSAYYHGQKETNNGTVTIVGGLKLKSEKILRCEFYDNQKQLLHNFKTKVDLVALDHDSPFHNASYSAYYMICNISCQRQQHCPTYVSIFDQFSNSNEAQKPLNLLRINYKNDDDGQRKYSFVLCLRPIHDFDDPLRFAEWIEFYRLMGVERFVVYNITSVDITIGPKTSCLIKSYVADNLIDVFPWWDPYGPENSLLIMNGQFIAYHDCIQRYKRIAKHLVVVDMDEMIMPSSPTVGNNYSEMMKSLNEHVKESKIPLSKVAGYSFRNGWFFTRWESGVVINDPYFSIEGNPKAENVLKRLVTAKNIVRSVRMEGHGDRSKMIVLPEMIVEISAHKVPKKVDPLYTLVLVDQNLAYSHHYRKCTADKLKYCENDDTIIENSSRRFSKFVAVRVADRFDLLRETCNITLS